MLRGAMAKTRKNPLWIRSGLNKPRLIWGRSVFLSRASNVSERLERVIGRGNWKRVSDSDDLLRRFLEIASLSPERRATNFHSNICWYQKLPRGSLVINRSSLSVREIDRRYFDSSTSINGNRYNFEKKSIFDHKFIYIYKFWRCKK